METILLSFNSSLNTANLYESRCINFWILVIGFRSIPIEKGLPGYAAVNTKTNIIYISYPTSNLVLAVNISEGTIKDKIPANSPGNIVVNDVTNKVYISSANGIVEIDGIDNRYKIINVGLPRSDGFIGINPIKNLLYATCFGHDILTIIDAPTGSIADKIPVGEDPKGVAIDTTKNKIYVANNASQSISVVDGAKSERLPDIYIRYRFGKYKNDSTLNPQFVILNESRRLLYVKVFEGYISAYGAYQGQSLIVIDIDTGKEINDRKISSNVPIGFAFNSNRNILYMKKNREKAIITLDAYANKLLNVTTVDKRSFWKRFYEGYQDFAEIIAVNTSTNKVYVSDSKNNLLYEIDG